MEIQQFVQKRLELFWFVKDPEKLSLEALVEAVLNLGDWQDVQELLALLGTKKVAEIFQKESQKKRNNYRPEIKNYFSLYFEKYA